MPYVLPPTAARAVDYSWSERSRGSCCSAQRPTALLPDSTSSRAEPSRPLLLPNKWNALQETELCTQVAYNSTVVTAIIILHHSADDDSLKVLSSLLGAFVGWKLIICSR